MFLFDYLKRRKKAKELEAVSNELVSSCEIGPEDLKTILNLTKMCEIKIHAIYESSKGEYEYRYWPERFFARCGWDAKSLLEHLIEEDLLRKFKENVNLKPVRNYLRADKLILVNGIAKNNVMTGVYLGEIKKIK